MPQFWTEGSRHSVSYITGPSHICLGLVVAASPNDRPQMVKRPATAPCDCGPVDEVAVSVAVRRGLEQFCTTTGVGLYATEIIYVENDSPRYDLYEHCANLLAARISKDQPA